MKLHHLAASCLTLLFLSTAAQSLEMGQKGKYAVLSGTIENGDEARFRAFMARQEASQIRIVYLNSGGGKVFAAYAIAREIRKAGLTTVVDGAKTVCTSACTGLFVAGLRRHYINAPSDNQTGGRRTGIGFHEASIARASGSRDYSRLGTSTMLDLYEEMGVPSAAMVIIKAQPDKMHYIGGPTALSLRIATSLSAP